VLGLLRIQVFWDATRRQGFTLQKTQILKFGTVCYPNLCSNSGPVTGFCGLLHQILGKCGVVTADWYMITSSHIRSNSLSAFFFHSTSYTFVISS